MEGKTMTSYLAAEVAVAEFLVGEVGVGDAVVVEGGADPAFILGALPGVDVADAGDGEGVGFDGDGGGGVGGEAELFDGRLEGGGGGAEDEGAGAEVMTALVAGEVEVLFGGFHFGVGVLEAEGGEGVVGVVFDDEDVSGAGDDAGDGDVGGDGGKGAGEEGFVLDFADGDVAHEGHGPAGVVVGEGVGGGIVLEGEVHVDEGAVGLVGADDVVAGGDGDVAEGGGGGGELDFDALAAEVVDHVGGVGAVSFAAGDDPAVDGAIGALGDGVLVLHPVIFEVELMLGRDLVEGDEDGVFLDVGVVARAPLDGGQGRVGAEPLAAGGGGGQGEVVVDVGAVGLDFVEAAEGVVGLGDPEEIVGDPAIVEAIGEDAGDALFGGVDDLGFGEQPPLIDGDGIERGIVGAGAGGGVEIGLGFVEVVEDGGVPLEHAGGDVLGEVEVLAHAVAVVIVRDVLAPVHERGARLFGFLAVVVGVDGLVAAVGFDDGGDEDDGVVADGLDEGGVLDDEAVGELDEHLRAAGLGRVDAGGDPVDGLGSVDELLGFGLGGFAGVGEGGEVALVFVEVLDGLFAGDGEDDHVAAFLALEGQLPELGAGGVLGELGVVAVDVGDVVELAGLAGHFAEEFEGVGILAEAGRWSTRSEVKRGSERYCLIFAV